LQVRKRSKLDYEVFIFLAIMNNSLYILVDNISNGYNVEFLDFISLLAILSGIFVIVSKNPIISVLFLIGLFLCISSYLILLGISFIGLSYLLVYVGAVSILFLFILMLINVRVSELQAETSNSLPLALIIGICFYYILSNILPFSSNSNNNELLSNVMNFYNDNKILYITSHL
jgi:NADH-ubiquinone oxidoreductase chain 6